MQQSQTDQTKQICRMSWFLIEVTEDEEPQEIKYFIVHSVDIDQQLSDNMYVDRVVVFSHNDSMIKGKLLVFADNHSYVEEEMQRRTSPSKIKRIKEKRALVQYTNSNNDLVYTVVSKTELFWHDQQNSKELFIEVNKNQYPAKVILITDDYKQLEDEFNNLKEMCLRKCPSIGSSIPTPKSWMLVQYSTGPLEAVYAIIEEKDTDDEWCSQNEMPNVATYIKKGEIIYQCLILRISQELHSLYVLRDDIKDVCFEFVFKNKQNSRKESF